MGRRLDWIHDCWAIKRVDPFLLPREDTAVFRTETRDGPGKCLHVLEKETSPAAGRSDSGARGHEEI